MTGTDQSGHGKVDCDNSPAEDRPSQMRLLATAACFLTRIPLGHRLATPDRRALSRCVVYFPLVGTIVGVVTALTVAAANQIWPVWIAVVLALAVEARLTGAFHEDALADFFDAMGGGWSREDVLKIMKDSRLGTYGAIALMLALACRAGTMATLVVRYGAAEWFIWVAAIVASSAIGRWTILPVMYVLPPITDSASLSRDIGERISLRQVVFGACLTLPAVVALAWFLPWQLASGVAFGVVAGVFFVRYVRRRLGGVTGDCLGCFCYLCQLTILLAATIEFPEFSKG